MQEPNLDEARRHLARAIDLRLAGDSREALVAADQAERAASADASAVLLGQIALVRGNLLADLGRYVAADEELEKAGGHFLQESRHVEYVQTVISRGRALAERGETEAALKFFAGIPLANLPLAIKSQVINNLGLLHRRRGDADKAIAYLSEDVDLCRRSGDDHGSAVALLNLAGVLGEAQREAEAVNAARAADELLTSLGRADLAASARDIARKFSASA